MGTKGFAFLVGTVAAGALLSGCVGGPPAAGGQGEEVHDRLYPLQRDAVRQEVDREYDEIYPGFWNQSWVWFNDRGLDLFDILSWDLQFGRGFGVNAHATEFLQAGIGWWDGTSIGSRGRSWGMWDESLVHRGLGPFYWIDVDRSPQWGTQTLWEHEYSYTGWDLLEENGNKAIDNDWTEVGASAQALAIGARVAGSPIELVDFVAGTITFGLVDIRNDDTRSKLEHRLREEKGLGQ